MDCTLFNSNNIRVVTIEGNPWFVAADVCKALGYKNPTEFVRGLDDDEKAKKFLGSGSPVNVLSESGLYKATLRAQRANPLARVFQDHVTKDILPSIRKTGAFVTGQPSLQENPQIDPLDLMMARLFQEPSKEKPTEISQGGPRGMSGRRLI